MKNSIVVVKIPVTKKGELNYFQINIPKDVERITGIETGISGLSGVTAIEINDKYLAGIAKVQAENTADLCYSSEIFIGTGILEKTIPGFVITPANQSFYDLLSTPNSGKAKQKMLIKNSHTLYGCYEDMLGKCFNRNLSYTIRLYLWTEHSEPNEKITA